MITLYYTLISTYIGSLLARIAYDKKIKIMAVFWIVFVTILLIFVSGLRDGIGDTGMYKHAYTVLVNDPKSVQTYEDVGFGLFNLFLIQFSTNPQILIFIVALITNIFNMICFSRYRSYIELQVFLYIASGYYIVTMNGIRQCMAAALLFYCTKYIEQRKFIKYFIFTLLISTIHGSALIMIPIYFIVNQEAWSKNMIKLIILAMIGILLYDILSPILFGVLEETQYGHYSDFNEGGSSFIRTIVNLVPVIFAYIKREELKEKWAESNIFVNMSIVNVIFVAFGMFNWIFNRFTLYLQLYNFILLPYIIRNCLGGKERRLIYFALIICYFIFFYFEQVMMVNLNYSSKYLNLNNILYDLSW